MASLPQHKIPVIDLSLKNLNSSSSCWSTLCGEVTSSLEKYGCFIALYDGVSPQLHDATFAASQDLLDLPTEIKALNTLDGAGHGYVGKSANMPLFERLSIENATNIEEVERFTKLMWPSGNESFCLLLEFATLSEEKLIEKSIYNELEGLSKSKSKGPAVQRKPLKDRDYEVDLDSRLGKTEVVTPIAPLNEQEPDTEICASMLDALNECIQVSGPLLDENQVRSIVDEIKKVITTSSSRKTKIAERTKAGEILSAQ